MISFIREGVRKGRKDHWCRLCNGDIPKGVEHYFQVNSCDGHIYTWRAHEDCNAYANIVLDWWEWENWEPDPEFRKEVEEWKEENHIM